MLPEKYSQSSLVPRPSPSFLPLEAGRGPENEAIVKVFYSFCSSGKDALALFHHFQDWYYHSNSHVMHHVTKWLYHTVQCSRTQLVYMHFTRPLPFLWKWVWLVRLNIMQEQVKVYFNCAAKNLRFFNTKHLFILHLKLQSFSTRILAFVTRPFLCWLGLGMRLVDNKIK